MGGSMLTRLGAAFLNSMAILIGNSGINQVLIAAGYNWNIADDLHVEADLRLPC